MRNHPWTPPARTPRPWGRTLLERLDPRVGMLSALALMFSAFAIGSFWQLLLAVVFTGVIAAAGRINVGRLAASVRVFLALFVFCGLLNIFFVRTGTTVASLGPIPITDDGIRIAILYACRFAVVIVIGAMFLASTTPTAMTDANHCCHRSPDSACTRRRRHW